MVELAAATPAGDVARFIPALSVIDFFDRDFCDVIDLRTAVEISARFAGVPCARNGEATAARARAATTAILVSTRRLIECSTCNCLSER